MRGLRLGLGLGFGYGASGGTPTPTPSAALPLLGMNESIPYIASEMVFGWTGSLDAMTGTYSANAVSLDASGTPNVFEAGQTQYISLISYIRPSFTAQRCGVYVKGGHYESGMIAFYNFGAHMSHVVEAPGGVPDANGCIFQFDYAIPDLSVSNIPESYIRLLGPANGWSSSDPLTGVSIRIISETPAGADIWLTESAPFDTALLSSTALAGAAADNMFDGGIRGLDRTQIIGQTIPITDDGYYEWSDTYTAGGYGSSAFIRVGTTVNGTGGFIFQCPNSTTSDRVTFATLLPRHPCGSRGNYITLQINAPSGASTTVSCTTSTNGWDIVVSPKSGALWSDIVTALNAHTTASQLGYAYYPTISGVTGDGSDAATSLAKTNLAGGSDFPYDGRFLATYIAELNHVKKPGCAIPITQFASGAMATAIGNVIKYGDSAHGVPALDPACYPIYISLGNETTWNYNQPGVNWLEVWGMYNGRAAPGSQGRLFAFEEYKARMQVIYPALKAVFGSDVIVTISCQDADPSIANWFCTNAASYFDAIEIAPYFYVDRVNYTLGTGGDASYYAARKASVDQNMGLAAQNQAYAVAASKGVFGYEFHGHDISDLTTGGVADPDKYADYYRVHTSDEFEILLVYAYSEGQRLCGFGTDNALMMYKMYGGISGGSSGAFYARTYVGQPDSECPPIRAFKRARAGDLGCYLIPGTALSITGDRAEGAVLTAHVRGSHGAAHVYINWTRDGTLIQTDEILATSASQTPTYTQVAADVASPTTEIGFYITMVDALGNPSSIATLVPDEYVAPALPATWYRQDAKYLLDTHGSSSNASIPALVGSNLPLALGSGATIGSGPVNEYDMLKTNAYSADGVMVSGLTIDNPLFWAMVFDKDNEVGSWPVPGKLGNAKFINMFSDAGHLQSYWLIPNQVFSIVNPMPSGRKVYWLFKEAGSSGHVYTGVGQTYADQGTITSYPTGSNLLIDNGMTIGANTSAGNDSSDVKFSGTYVLNPDVMTLTEALHEVDKMQTQWSAP